MKAGKSKEKISKFQSTQARNYSYSNLLLFYQFLIYVMSASIKSFIAIEIIFINFITAHTIAS